ncbi:MAG: hypothetical protein GQ533_09715 [Methanosarcinaceae archaeon]|nr:hypothetical protein [Methanosarcinaceae archaeon]
MVYRKSLKNREYGFEFSGTEYSLIFEHDNMGFVRFAGRSKKIFYLDPSPFLPTPKKEKYILEKCQPPKNGELIRVTSLETETVVRQKFGLFNNVEIKYVRAWEKINPNKLIHRKVLHQDEFIDYFKIPFIGISDHIEPISRCLALYCVSSPSIGSNHKGGIDTAMLTGKNQWSAFKKLMSIIPNNFKKTTSSYFYGMIEKEKNIQPVNSLEVSRAFKNPIDLFVHIPVTLKVELKKSEYYRENIDFQIPMMRSHLLDALLFRPEIQSNVESHIIESIYDMIENVESNKMMTYKQDIGNASPKLSSAFARLNFSEKVTKENIKESKSMWEDMFVRSQQEKAFDLPKVQSKRSIDAQNLYYDLHNIFGVESVFSMDQIKEETKYSEWILGDAIAELQRCGAVYSPTNTNMKLIDLKI